MTDQPPLRTSRRTLFIRGAAALVLGAACAFWAASPGYDRLTVSALVSYVPTANSGLTRPSAIEVEIERRRPRGAYLAWGFSESFGRTFITGDNRANPIQYPPLTGQISDAEIDAYLAAHPRPGLPYWSRVGEPNPGVTYQAGTQMLPDFVSHEHAIGWPLRMVGLRARASQDGWTDVVAERAFVGRRELRWYEAIYWAARWHADQVFVIWPGLAINVAMFAVPAFGLMTIAKRSAGAAVASRRLRRGLCPACGHSRAGLAEGAKCPECGKA